MTHDPAFGHRLMSWRRHLHQNPELGLEEHQTAAFVAARLKELGIEVTEGVGGTGVVGTIRRGGNRAVGLRADMDALPIQEISGVPHASRTPGVMHACGHDGHTTSLLGAAELLARDTSWAGTVHLVFQPAEEGRGGAKAMLADGLFERFPMERIFGYHNWPGLPAGTIAVHDGPVMAMGGRLVIEIEGHAGHAALPHLTRDPIVAAGNLLVAIQTTVSRNIDPMSPSVVSIGMIQGGEAANQIARQVTLRGTARALNDEVFTGIEESLERICAGIAQAHGVRCKFTSTRGAALTRNTSAEADMAAEAVESSGAALRRDLPAAMTGEDFGWMLMERPGAYVWIGNGPAENGIELHNPRYDYNDTILPVAAGWYVEVAKRALRG
jgi:hippurate hydrolase